MMFLICFMWGNRGILVRSLCNCVFLVGVFEHIGTAWGGGPKLFASNSKR